MKKIFAVILTLGLIFSLCACGGDKNGPTGTETLNNQQQNDTETYSEEESVTKFKVTLVDQNGDPVPNTMIQICKDTCVPKSTDENGVAQFDFEETDGHKLSLFSCPEGYETEYVGDNYIYLEDGETEYTFEITKK